MALPFASKIADSPLASFAAMKIFVWSAVRESAIFDANGNAIAGPHGFGAGTIPLVAANPDGTRFAAEFVSGAAAQIILLDAALNQVATPVSFSAQALPFSRDGTFLYAS